ncbi:hypothetical protein LSAT2_015041 [Lamellibrachia satsuma]|nr:hypothetical protein LSAT2_015041 [Lamellibrachia satsuma]
MAGSSRVTVTPTTQVPSTSHTPTSATQRKFDYKSLLRETAIPGDDEPEVDPDDVGSDTISTVIARVCKLSELVKMLPCPSCRSNTLAVRAVNCTVGLVCKLQTYCTSCDDVINSSHSSDRVGGTAGHLPFVVRRAVVSASLDMGVGHSGIVKLCRYLDMNATNQTTFAVHSQAVVDASKVVANNILTDAAKIVRQVYADPSVAGTSVAGPSITDSDADDEVMEVEAAEILWGRSLERGFRYTAMVSDGDSRTFKHLTEKKVYGDDVVIVKEECINHVAKRMGTALRKLATQTKKAGVTLGGRGHGKLTLATITKLTAYYGKAIRAHPRRLDRMQNAVFATFNHAASTDDKPNHDRCPKGKDSWCFYQRALAEGKQPGNHLTNIGTPLSPEVATHVEEIYLRLGQSDLLSRCLLAEFNSGAQTTVEQLYGVMGMTTGPQLIASAEKADRKRLRN